MEIGIFEYANPGHFTLVDSVARIFSSSDQNQVSLLTSTNHKENSERLLNKLGRNNLEVTSHNSTKELDLAVIVTPDHQLDRTLEVVESYPTWIFIHNIDDWFDLSLRKTIRQFSNALFRDKNPKLAYYLVKRALKGNRLRKRIIQHQLNEKGAHFLVLNEDLKRELSNYIPEEKIKIIPFSVYDPELPDLSRQNTKIRICVPGILSQKRRDYLSLFAALEKLDEVLLEKIEIDLLGGVSPTAGEQSEIVVTNAQRLIEKGLPIIIRNKEYIELDEFDLELSKADIILGNLNIDQGGGSMYGKTKESGIPFTMIRAAKPGIMPEGYRLLSALENCTKIFGSYPELETILSQITEEKELKDLKINALEAAKYYTDTNQLAMLWE